MHKISKRKLFLLCIISIISISIAGCGCKHEFDDGVITKEPTCTEEGVLTKTCTLCQKTQNEAIPCIPHDYVEEIIKDSTYDTTGEKKFTCKVCGDSYSEEIPIKEYSTIVTVTDKRNIPKDIYNYTYSDRVELTISIENITDSPIKAIQGILHIKDLFGEEIMSNYCNFTGKLIPAKSSVTFSELGFNINEFIDSNVKLYNENFDDLIFEYEETKVIFENNIPERNEPTCGSNGKEVPIIIKVTEKINTPMNIYNGIYSPRVDYSFIVENHSDKDIKGIQGSLITKDIFGSEILTIGCDFTGKTFPSNDAIPIYNLGIDINEFIDSNVELYNESYDDLIFKYEVSSIVYTDGTSESF